MDQKVKQHRFLKYLWLLRTPKKLIQCHLLRPGSGSGSDQKGSDPDPQHSTQLNINVTSDATPALDNGRHTVPAYAVLCLSFLNSMTAWFRCMLKIQNFLCNRNISAMKITGTGTYILHA
jgi:hypothetical protein